MWVVRAPVPVVCCPGGGGSGRRLSDLISDTSLCRTPREETPMVSLSRSSVRASSTLPANASCCTSRTSRHKCTRHARHANNNIIHTPQASSPLMLCFENASHVFESTAREDSQRCTSSSSQDDGWSWLRSDCISLIILNAKYKSLKAGKKERGGTWTLHNQAQHQTNPARGRDQPEYE
jgi:hypothetical protein